MSRGLDKIPHYNQLVCFMPFYEGVGTALHDISREHLLGDMSVAPPTWAALATGLPILDFTPTDYATIAAAYTVLDFTAEDFSIAAWVNVDDLSVTRYIFIRGLASTDGYGMYISNTAGLAFWTWQAAAAQNSATATGIISLGSWYALGVSRNGASVRLYVNGIDLTDAVGTHINPLTSVRSAKIGVYDNLTIYPFDGKMALLHVWENVALSPAAHQAVFDYEKKFFPGV